MCAFIFKYSHREPSTVISPSINSKILIYPNFTQGESTHPITISDDLNDKDRHAFGLLSD